MAGSPPSASPAPSKLCFLKMLQMWALLRRSLHMQRHPFHFTSTVSCSQDLLVSLLKMHCRTWKKIKIISNPMSCEVKKRLKPYCSFILYCNPLGEEGGLWQFDLSGNWSIFSADSFIAPESHWWWDQAQNKQAEKSYDFSVIREDGDKKQASQSLGELFLPAFMACILVHLMEANLVHWNQYSSSSGHLARRTSHSK